MLKPRWKKVIRDMWLNRSRTVLVVLSIAVGIFAVGVIGTTQIVLSEQLNESYQAINPTAAMMVGMGGDFDDDVLKAVEKMPEVEAAEGRRNTYIRVKKDEDEWIIFQFNAIKDFDDIQVDKFRSDSGKWPPEEQEILIERSAMRLINAEVGDIITVKDLRGKERQVRLVGTAQDVYALMYTFQNFGYAYVNFDTMEWLGVPRNYNDLRFTVAEGKTDRDHIKNVSWDVQDKLEKAGLMVFTVIPVPGQHPLNMVIQPLLALLAVFGFLALLLSAFLVVNTISALLAQQQKQIGIMKAVGAKNRQIVGLYFVTVLIFGIISLVIALPLGALGAKLFAQTMATALNLDLPAFYVPPIVLITQTAVALIIPLAAAAYPIFQGARITVREAVSDYGLGQGQFGSSWFDRVLLTIRVEILKRPTIISIRNTFRRKGRLILTMITLILGGAIFISVFSIQASLQSTLDSMLDYYRYDVMLQFQRPYRLTYLDRELTKVDGVESFEGWNFANVRRARPDGTESDGIILYAPPARTELVHPTLLEGRWLTPEDENAVVINSMVLSNESDLKVGSEVTLKIQGQESTWKIVGIAMGGQIMPTMFVNYEHLSQNLGQVDKAMYAFIKTGRHTPEERKETLTRIEEHLESIGAQIGAGITVDEDIAGIKIMFDILFGMMLTMAILLAFVGGLGLMGTMSINVLERTREMGVMRAIGASTGSILQIVEVEGILIGVLSWTISILVALPISKAMSNLIGQQMLSADLNYTFSTAGALIWLAVVIILSGFSSFLPAWRAARITVREVLAYE
ncbi:MAG TPA: FtsX-like permease family protein [Chloroflexi bacterium]|nr:FtsX-like permease family protein [Chloroflexota bacterium]